MCRRWARQASFSISILNVLEGAPAQKAGLKKDDIVLKVNGQDVEGLRATVAMISQCRPGSDLTMRVRRDGKEQDVTLKLGVVPFYFLD